MAKRGRPDPLQVQIALRIKAPKGSTISPRVLNQIIDKMVNNEPLPPTIEVRGVFWRNPNRRGSLAYWRYHYNADFTGLKNATKGLDGTWYIDGVPAESAPRGSLSEAIGTLAGALYSGNITF